MTQTQIEQAARDFVRLDFCARCRDNDGCANNLNETCADRDLYIDFFIAGVTFRQPEVDSLTADNQRPQKDVADGLKREEIARKVIEEKRKENETLTALLDRTVWVWSAPLAERCKPYAEQMYDVVREIEKLSRQ